MARYKQVEGGKIVNIVECSDEHAQRVGMIKAEAADRIHEEAPSVKEIAARALVDIDAKAGMPRLMRETLLAIAGDKAPKQLVDIEAQAALERAKLK